jgi:acetyl/propionyl-CoA carboxylase alpha subunit
MLAKVLVVAPHREAALARARRAVAEFETGGVQTTLPFHGWLLAHPEFVEGRLRTDLVARDWRPEPLHAAAAERAADAVARHVWQEAGQGSERAAGPVDPVPAHRVGWRPEPWS